MFGLMTKVAHRRRLDEERRIAIDAMSPRLNGLEAQRESAHAEIKRPKGLLRDADAEIAGLKQDIRAAESAADNYKKKWRELAEAITGGDSYIDARSYAGTLHHRLAEARRQMEDAVAELKAMRAAEDEQKAHERAERAEIERQANPYLSDRPRTVQLRRVDSSMILLTRKGVTEIERAPNGHDLDVRITGAFGMDRFTVTRDLRLSVEWDDEQAEGA